MGFEPTTSGTTNRYSNQLSYSHRINCRKSNEADGIKKQIEQNNLILLPTFWVLPI